VTDPVVAKSTASGLRTTIAAWRPSPAPARSSPPMGVAVRHALRQLRAAAAIVAAPSTWRDRGAARAPGGRRL